MLKTLVDLFLLISTDKKTITSTNISSFYQFITKKLPEIDNHRPTLLISSLNKNNIPNKNNEIISNKKEDKFIFQYEKNSNKFNSNITLKRVQNELLSLFNDMIDYLYEENIIILSKEKEGILKSILSKKLKENNLSFSSNFDNKLIHDLKSIEIRKYIIDLINSNKCNNNFICFNFSIKHFINFFNTKNKDKNRLIAEKFITIINPIIKIYQNDKKIIYHKKIKKTKTKSLSKIPVLNIYNNHINKERTTKKKNLKTSNSNTNYSHKINHSFNKDLKDKFNLNGIIIKAKKRKTEFNKNRNEPKDNIKEEYNLTKDTIPCQTLNNCISFNVIQKNCIIDNYLNNNIKNILNNINDKNNKANSEKVVINEFNNFYSNSQMKYLKNKKNYIKIKSNLLLSNNNDIYGKNNKNNNIIHINEDDYDLEDFHFDVNEKKRKTNITSISKKEDNISEKHIQCVIF